LLHIFSLLSSFYETLDLRCRVCPVFYFAVKIQNNALIHAIFTKFAAVGGGGCRFPNSPSCTPVVATMINDGMV